jgi:hypothetical protein
MDGIDWEDTYRFRKQIFLRHTGLKITSPRHTVQKKPFFIRHTAQSRNVQWVIELDSAISQCATPNDSSSTSAQMDRRGVT